MNFRTPYFVGLIACVVLIIITSFMEQTVSAAEGLMITGPNGEVRETRRQYGPTRSSDTFWSIAQKMQPDPSVSIYQVMGAIYDANPHAFSNPNYNSLVVGMILLIPPKEQMLAIPKSLAKQRAERNDVGWKKIAAKPTVISEPTTTKVASSVVTKTVVLTPSAETLIKDDNIANRQLEMKLEALEDKNLQLTDALGRAQDELNISGSDIEVLTKKVDDQNESIALLQEQLQASRLKNESLSADVEALKDKLTQMAIPAPQEEQAKWQELMDNPLVLLLTAGLSTCVFLFLLWLFLKRRRNEMSVEETPEQAVIEPVPSPDVMEHGAEDSVDEMSVDLDAEEDTDSLDLLMNVDSNELQPEVEMEIDANESTMEGEVFIDSNDLESQEEDVDSEDEGQSLDELWAEAMGEQDGEEDLDSLLEGFDTDEKEGSSVDTVDDSEADLDSLLAEDNSIEIEAEEQGDEADLDSLLAGFDENDAGNTATEQTAQDPEDDLTNLRDEITAVLETDTIDQQVDETELDALLAGLDEPQATDPAPNDTAVNDPATNDTDDPDAVNTAAEEAAPDPEAELEEDTLDEEADDGDLDALLTELDEPQESDPAPNDAASNDPATNDVDEPDAVNTAAEEAADPEADLTNLSAEIAAELEEDTLDEEVNDADLDALLTELDEPQATDPAPNDAASNDPATNDVDEPDVVNTAAEEAADPEADLTNLSAEIAAELEEDTLDEEADDGDLDALLTELDEPQASDPAPNDTASNDPATNDVDEPDAVNTAAEEAADLEADLTNLSADIAAELAELEDDSLDEEADLDVLLTELDEPQATDPATNDADDPDAVNTAAEESADLEADLTNLSADIAAELENDSLDEEAVALESLTSEVQKDGPHSEHFEEEYFSADNNSNKQSDEQSSEDMDVDLSTISEDKITVDEVLAALDEQEGGDVSASDVAEDDLTAFKKDNDFIDIDRLLNEADEDTIETDQYKELDVDMGELDNLMGNAAMVDVDDEENSINAKLDLARAYIEIDDNDSAIALLKEVELDGNDRQKEEAEGLFKTLG